MRRTSKPVAKGSSVPAWPARRIPRARRAMATTSCEVMPAGLSTRSTPSVEVILAGGGRPLPFLHLREQRLDARRALDGRIVVEGERGREVQCEHFGEARTHRRRDRGEAFHRLVALGGGAHDADEDLRVAQVARDVHAGDRDETHDARVLHAADEHRRDLFADRLRDAVGAPIILGHLCLPGRTSVPLQRARDLLRAITLDAVADLQVVEVLDPDAALEALADLLRIVLEAAQGADDPIVHLHGVAHDANAARAIDHAAAHHAAGDDARLGHLEAVSYTHLTL